MIAAFGIVAVVIMALLTVSALFSAAETAMTGASRARMHQLERDGDKAAARVNRLISNQERMIGALLLGNSLINILSSALVTDVLERQLPRPWGVIISTGVMTVLVLVYAEVLPKTVAIGRPDDVARVLSWPTYVTVKAFGPVISGIQWVIVKVLALFGFEVSPEADASAAQEEIRGAIEYHHEEGLVEDRDRRMLGGVLDLSEMDVTQIMVHRKNIVMLDADLPPREVVTEALEAPFTRLPLYRGDSENIIGVLHARDLARAIAACDGDVDRVDIVSVARRPFPVARARQQRPWDGPARRAFLYTAAQRRYCRRRAAFLRKSQ